MLEVTQKEAGPLQSYRLGGGRGRVWLSLTVGRTAPCSVCAQVGPLRYFWGAITRRKEGPEIVFTG